MTSKTPSSDQPADDSRSGSKSATGDEAGKKVVRVGGRYEVVKHIATGGMGAVYRARDLQDGREVALKILPKEMAAKAAMLERFRREVRSASRLKHENIVEVYDFGETGGQPYFVMEFINGVDLHDYVKRKGSLDPEEARQIVLQAARALQHAGDHGIIHRDIKPSNFLLMRKHGRPVVKLTDFGLAREVSADEYRVTRAGTTVGTVDYMSPEQARDSSAADTRSDLYSLGSTWYHLLSGQAPFPEGGLGERLIKIMTELPPDIRELTPLASDETWAVLSKLLEKDPADRYQTPEELIEALVALEGNAVAPARSSKQAKKKPARKTRQDDETKAEAPDTRADGGSSKLMYILGGCAALVAVLAVVAALAWPKQPAENKDPDKLVVQPPDPIIAPPIPDKDKGPIVPIPPKDKDKGGKTPDPIVKPPVAPRWPALYKTAEKIDTNALREEVEKPFADRSLDTGEPFVARVSRLGAHRSLADAIAAAPEGSAIVVEIHDNGPFFELPARVEGRRLTIKAGKGYRPLVVWDLPATVDRRKREKKTDPLVLFGVTGGNLHLEGLELALRWPEGLAEPLTLADVTDGDVSLTDCTVSSAGKPAASVTLARLRANTDAQRCRFTRVHARSGALTALDLDAPGGVALFDGCLLVGGQAPLVRVKGDSTKGARIRFVRSTLLSSRSVVELRSVAEADKSPSLDVLAWDSLFARTGQEEAGDLLTIRNRADTRSVVWRPINSLYVNFKNLLVADTTLAGNDGRGWRQHWKHLDGDDGIIATWPEKASVEPATQPLLNYEPNKSVGFASTVDPEKPLGCDLKALPAARDGWVGLAFEPNPALIDLPSDSIAPEIPALEDGLYHGEKIDLTKVDLGEYLRKQLAAKKPGPKIVLHLSGKGDSGTSPIRLANTNLVLFFAEPADEKAAKPALKLTTADASKSLIEVENGSVEIINGVLRLVELPGARGSHLIRVKGGDVKLYRTRLEGPQIAVPTGWQAALSVAGSGDTAADKARICALNECAIVSGKAGIVLAGIGMRLAVRESVIVAGGDAITIDPGEACKEKTNIQVTLQQTTLAARGAIVHLGDAPKAGIPDEPILIQTRDCAYLNPFVGARAGLLLADGDSLSRGLLVWHSERDGIDQRLHYAAKTPSGVMPVKREGLVVWQRLWGSAGVRSPRPEFGFQQPFDTKRWALERLNWVNLKDGPGADLKKLGITRK